MDRRCCTSPPIVLFFILSWSIPLNLLTLRSSPLAGDDQHTLLVPETVVTARRSKTPVDHTPASVTVVARDALAAVPALDAGEALNYVPGLNLQRSGGTGQPVLQSIYGADYRHVLVLLDGVPMNTLAEGLASLEEVGLAAVDRIEIVKGPGSAVWGSSLGGVINILSRPIFGKSRLPTVEASTSYGRWATRHSTLLLDGRAGRVGYLASGERTTSDGFRAKSAHTGNGGFVKLNSEIASRGLLSASYSVAQGETENFEVERPRRTPYWRLLTFTNRYGSLQFDWAASQTTKATLKFGGIKRLNGLAFIEKGGTARLQSFNASELTLGPTIQVHLAPTANNDLVLGGGFDRSTVDLSSSGGKPNERVYQGAVYANDSHDIRWLTALGAVRYDRNSSYGWQVSPNLGLVARLPFDRTVVRATFARGFSAPPLLSKYIPETVDRAPNPDIKPERAWTTQLGLETQPCGNASINLTAYQANVRDAIQAVVNEKEQAIDENFARFRKRGLEAELQLRLTAGLSAFGGATVNQVTDLATGAAVHGQPRRTYDVHLNYRRPSRFSAGIFGHYVWYDVDPVYASRFGFTTKDRRFLWDLKAAHSLPVRAAKLTAEVSVHNLLNTRAWWISPYPLPPRWVEVGVRCEW